LPTSEKRQGIPKLALTIRYGDTKFPVSRESDASD
jgi:hypothetical protein